MHFFQGSSQSQSLWNRDFERLSRRLHQLQTDSRGMSSGSLAILHKELRGMINEANLLEQQVAADVAALSNEATASHVSVTRRELLLRTDKMKTFMDDLQTVEKTILQGRVESPPEAERSRIPEIAQDTPTNMTQEIGQVIDMQQQAINTQNKKLTHLESDVRNLKNISNEVNAEISLHNELLDETVPQVDRVQRDLEQTQETLRQTFKKHSSCIMILVITLEILAIILVLAYL